MTRIAFGPVYRSVAFVARPSLDRSGPAYDLVQTAPDSYPLPLSVPGFAENELEIVAEPGALTVRGRIAEQAAEEVRYLHRGIARRPFEQRFPLAPHVEVKGAELDHGLLRLTLVRELPEALKPRSVPVTSAAAARAA